MTKSNKFILTAIGISVFIIGGLTFLSYVRPTRIALINFRDFQYSTFLEVDKNPFIRVDRVSLEKTRMTNLKKYPVIYMFGMGLRLNDLQIQSIKQAISKGAKIYSYAATSAESDLSNLSGEELDYVEGYFSNSGKTNIRRLINYSRRILDKKKFLTEEIEDPLIIPLNLFFHLGDETFFSDYEEYQKFYLEKGLYKENAQRVAVVTTNIGPRNANRDHVDMLIRELEAKEINVYPVSGFGKRLEFLKKIKPSLVVLLPHGRFVPGKVQESIKWLQEENIPLLCPVTVFRPYEEWVKDQRGMAGGMLSQSIVVPELDGGISPYVFGAQFKNEKDLYVFKGIPNRVKNLAETIKKWLVLRRKPNAEKKVAIYYYKGPGLNAMVAGGMEVAPSLLNLLQHLKEQGYETGELPEDELELLDRIQKEGPVLGVYAKGSFQKFLEQGQPELVDVDTYLSWCKKNLEIEMYDEIVRNYGEAPGEYMSLQSQEKSYLAIARIQFGNVVILPQPLPGYGDNETKLIHGAKKAPPHPYVAAYLWAKNGFRADAVIHFGTHGSLEFTPWKQVALSEFDWPDALIGGIPHLYIYVINNIGEAVIAKRRSYATILSHLTPPFTESDLYGEFSNLHDKFHGFLKTEDEALKSEYLKSIKKYVIKIGLDKDLGLDDFENQDLTRELFDKIHNYMHSIEQEKITRGLYTLGKKYQKEYVYETAKLMAIDPLAYSFAKLALSKEEVTQKQIEDAHYFDAVYRQKAFMMIDGILTKGVDPFIYFNKEDMKRLEEWDGTHEKMSDEDFMANMMRLAASGQPKGKADKGQAHVSDAQRGRIEELILEVAPYKEKRAFLLSLKDGKKLKKASFVLDPKSLEKARKVARFIPEMKKAIDLAAEKEIKELIEIMQDNSARKQVFDYLSDKNILEKIKKQEELLREKNIQKCLDSIFSKDLFVAIDNEKLKNMLKLWDKKRLIIFKANIEFYLANAPLASYLAAVDSPNAKAIAAILKSKLSRDLLEKSISAVEKKIGILNDEEKECVHAIRTYRDTLLSVNRYFEAIYVSTDSELNAVINGLNGGYISPSSGGDPISNPSAVPTGRNMYSIDTEKTPTEEAWKVGVDLAEKFISSKLEATGEYPKKVAFTLWGGEFIRGQGVALAEIFYLLGVEPVRNSRGVVHDVRLIPSSELKRPRIDVVVQTSGQFRDIAATRVYLINKAVRIASEAEDGEQYKNYVKEGTQRAEEVMKEKGLSPLDARKFSVARVFGGVNGNYGTGIMGLVESGDKWEDDKEISDRYLKNMGAVYTKDNWGRYQAGVFEAALQNTDTVVQPRSSNTWGPLSLDHIYEFMGGINATIRNVTGEDPDAYFNDLRNKHNPNVQGVKEAIWVETRTTLFNPKYIKDLQKGGASSAEKFAETFRNTYGWNVMKPKAIDKEIWEGLYDVYVKDEYNLGLEKFFRDKNPYALQEMTAVMLETIRKGYWKADKMTIKTIAELHAKLVKDHKAGCSGFVCDNAKLRQMIAGVINQDLKEAYQKEISEARVGETRETKEGMKLEKEKITLDKVKEIVKENFEVVVTMLILVLLFGFAVIWGAVKRRA